MKCQLSCLKRCQPTSSRRCEPGPRVRQSHAAFPKTRASRRLSPADEPSCCAVASQSQHVEVRVPKPPHVAEALVIQSVARENRSRRKVSHLAKILSETATPLRDLHGPRVLRSRV